MIYRRDDGQLTCQEHPEQTFGDAPLGDNLGAMLALGHLERYHPEIVDVLRRSELVRLNKGDAQ